MLEHPHRQALGIDNNIMFSLMFSYLMLLIALQSTLYVWSSLITVLFVLWRFLNQRRKTPLPTPLVINALAIGCCTMVFFSSLSGGVLNGMTNLLLLGTAMKLLAINTDSGVKHLCLALFFTIASAFIFKQDMAFTVFVLFIFAGNTYTLLMVHCPAMTFKNRSQYGLRFLLTSLPLILFLFALMPRFGPLWKMPSAKGSSTGLSENINPGDFSSLAQSSKLAFRVAFDGPTPENKDLYWRTMVHERFDGKQWSVDRFRKAPQNIARVMPSQADIPAQMLVSYQVIAEPTYQDWLYALDTPIAHSTKLNYHYDRRLTSVTPVTQKLQYEVTSALKHPQQIRIFELERQLNLLQPKQQNPRAQKFARELRAASNSDIEYVSKVLSYFIDNKFIYTLEPPLLPVDPVDGFLFDTQAGFCSHFASAFGALMRAAGIPARVVSGYQGGERADGDKFISVYQYGAHAWNEIWLADRGWVRVDPTATVSPERIALGLQAAMQNDDSFLSGEMFNLVKYRHFAVLNWLRNQLNNMDFYWSTWILNFDTKKQAKLFESLWGKQDSIIYSLYTALVLIGFMLFIYWLSKGRQFKTQHSALYHAHSRLLKVSQQFGFTANAGTPPISYLQQFARQHPDLAEPLNKLSDLYHRCLYQELDDSQYQQLLGQIKQTIKQLKRRAPVKLGLKLGFLFSR